MDDNLNNLDKELEQAYLNAYYQVEDPPLAISIGSDHPALDEVLEKRCPCYRSWTLITAYNPGSEIQTDAFNTKKQAQLLQLIRRKGYSFLPAEGGCKENSWPSEKSILIINLPLDEAVELAILFGQKAFVRGEKKGTARLHWT